MRDEELIKYLSKNLITESKREPYRPPPGSVLGGPEPHRPSGQGVFGPPPKPDNPNKPIRLPIPNKEDETKKGKYGNVRYPTKPNTKDNLGETSNYKEYFKQQLIEDLVNEGRLRDALGRGADVIGKFGPVAALSAALIASPHVAQQSQGPLNLGGSKIKQVEKQGTPSTTHTRTITTPGTPGTPNDRGVSDLKLTIPDFPAISLPSLKIPGTGSKGTPGTPGTPASVKTGTFKGSFTGQKDPKTGQAKIRDGRIKPGAETFHVETEDPGMIGMIQQRAVPGSITHTAATDALKGTVVPGTPATAGTPARAPLATPSIKLFGGMKGRTITIPGREGKAGTPGTPTTVKTDVTTFPGTPGEPGIRTAEHSRGVPDASLHLVPNRSEYIKPDETGIETVGTKRRRGSTPTPPSPSTGNGSGSGRGPSPTPFTNGSGSGRGPSPTPFTDGSGRVPSPRPPSPPSPRLPSPQGTKEVETYRPGRVPVKTNPITGRRSRPGGRGVGTRQVPSGSLAAQRGSAPSIMDQYDLVQLFKGKLI